jgi:hypothetical protein
MKKTIPTLILLVVIFALTACNNSTSETSLENTTGDGTPNSERQFTMPTEMKLILGTVKLDETEYAVDAEQASELLPLWKALRSLSESDTVAQAEIDALITQLEKTMSPEQTGAIESMDLTMQDMASVMETLGIETGGFGAGAGEITPEMWETMEAARESGDFPGGGPGGGMGLGGGMGPGGGPGGEFGGGEMDPSVRETAMAERSSARGAGFGLNTNLLDAIIEFLEAKVQ